MNNNDTEFLGIQDGSPDLFPVDANGQVISSDTNIIEAWRVLEDLRAQGLVRHIGVSNFNRAQIDRLCTLARDPPEYIQVQHCNRGYLNILSYHFL